MRSRLLSNLAPGVGPRAVALGAVALVHVSVWSVAFATYGVLVPPAQMVAETFSTLAIVLLSCNLFLATRAPVAEKGLKGLDKLFVTHRLVGLTVAVLVATHFTLVPKSLGWVPSKIIGYPMITLLLAMIFVASAPRFPWARLVPLKYQTWKATHRLNGLFVAAAVVHSLYAPAYVHFVPLLTVYVYGVASLGLLAWLYRELLFARVGPFRSTMVAEIRYLGGRVTEITLEPAGGTYVRKPGQFAFVSFSDGPSLEQHPFTLSSGPEARPRFSIKASGDFTDALPKGVPTGSAARIEGPYGAFSVDRGRADQLWLAGGIGITPFLAMAAGLGEDTRVLLVWSVRTREEAAYDEDLARMARERTGLDYRLHVTSEQGHVDVASLVPADGLRTWSAFVCGPVPMRLEMVRRLRGLGVPRSEIFYEEFRLR